MRAKPQCKRGAWRLASMTMTRLERNVNITAVLLPFLVVAAAIPLLWGRLIGPSDVIVFAVMYVVCGLGVTVGYHRMLTHRAFQTHPATRYVFAVLGSMAIQGPVIEWSPTTASTTPTPTRKAIPTRPTSATGRACAVRSGVSGTPTWAGCGAPTGRRGPTSTRANSSRTAA